jgi:hypothetical protein
MGPGLATTAGQGQQEIRATGGEEEEHRGDEKCSQTRGVERERRGE